MKGRRAHTALDARLINSRIARRGTMRAYIGAMFGAILSVTAAMAVEPASVPDAAAPYPTAESPGDDIAVAQQQAVERERQAWLCYETGMAQPTPTGSLAESFSNAQRAYVECLNGRPMPAPRPLPLLLTQTDCQPNGGGLTCATR
jgi:hypothetical protein